MLKRKICRTNLKVLLAVIIAALSTCNTVSAGSYSPAMDCSSVWDDETQQSNTSDAIRLPLVQHEHPCSPIGRQHTALPLWWHRSRALDREQKLLFFRRRRAPPPNISAPVAVAGLEYGYVTQVALGTPPIKQTVLIDTAASFSWVQCSPCGRSGCYDQDGPLLDSRRSSTYSAVPCSASLCASAGGPGPSMARTGCGVGEKTCLYSMAYMDGSVSKGCLSKDTLAVAGESFAGFVFGCSRQYEPTFGRYSGIFGFANGPLSFFSQLVDKSGRYRAFAYYLPSSPSSAGYIQVGSYDKAGLAFTPMLVHKSEYLLLLTGIAVDGCPLGIQPARREYPVYLDLGSSFSILPRHVHQRLCDAVAGRIKGYEHIESAEKCCFDPSFLSAERAVPTVHLEFRDGVRLVLDEDRLMYRQPDGSLCLGFVPSYMFMLGSMQMQMIHVVQDIEKSVMGFPKT